MLIISIALAIFGIAYYPIGLYLMYEVFKKTKADNRIGIFLAIAASSFSLGYMDSILTLVRK